MYVNAGTRTPADFPQQVGENYQGCNIRKQAGNERVAPLLPSLVPIKSRMSSEIR